MLYKIHDKAVAQENPCRFSFVIATQESLEEMCTIFSKKYFAQA